MSATAISASQHPSHDARSEEPGVSLVAELSRREKKSDRSNWRGILAAFVLFVVGLLSIAGIVAWHSLNTWISLPIL
jgi:hypothetical protein